MSNEYRDWQADEIQDLRVNLKGSQAESAKHAQMADTFRKGIQDLQENLAKQAQVNCRLCNENVRLRQALAEKS